MASASAVGFLRPAKRAAFGDVTNVSRATTSNGVSSKDGVKPAAVKTSITTSQTNTRAIAAATNKENVTHSRKDSLKGGFQRTAAAAAAMLKPRSSNTNTHNNNNHSLPIETIQPLHELPAPKGPHRHSQSATISTTSSAHISHIPTPSTSSSTREPRLHQPRHHKSQPQLKQKQAPILRKTQSKQFERAEPLPSMLVEPLLELPELDTESVGTAISTDSTDVESGNIMYLDSVSDAADLEPLVAVTQAQDADHSANCVPAGGDASAAAFKESTGPVSEPEEYWDEEYDEDYDDQDQAYTTAHSFRSRDLTTGNVTTMLAPRVTNKVHKELEDARREVEASITPDELEEEFWDVTMVAEYGDEIFEYMRELEVKMMPNPHYMENQTEIQWSMRSVLMDWLVQVHSRFNLLPETLFLTVNYIDRFLSYKVVSVGKLQLVGATAILVAAKYEEIHCPSLEEIEYMVDNGYTADEILKAERFMLSMLSFELGFPGPMSFLRRVSKADNYDLDTRTLAKYFIELTIMDERFVATPPSFLAAGAHCLSRLILGKGDWVSFPQPFL